MNDILQQTVDSLKAELEKSTTLIRCKEQEIKVLSEENQKLKDLLSRRCLSCRDGILTKDSSQDHLNQPTSVKAVSSQETIFVSTSCDMHFICSDTEGQSDLSNQIAEDSVSSNMKPFDQTSDSSTESLKGVEQDSYVETVSSLQFISPGKNIEWMQDKNMQKCFEYSIYDGQPFLEIPKSTDSCDKSAKPHSCEICGKGYRTRKNLRRHSKIHKNDKSHVCEDCGKCFSSAQTLKIHRYLHSGNKPFKCTSCEKTFVSDFILKAHQRSHTGEKPFKCDYCDKEFTTNAKLKRHCSVHTGETPFVCKICGKGFRRSEYCKFHEKRHEGAKDYPCNVCGNFFSTQSAQRTHMRTHTGVKPYKCTICERSFAQSKTLTYHMISHTGVKHFICDKCGKSFGRKDHLTQHQRVHNKKKKALHINYVEQMLDSFPDSFD